MTIRNPRPNEVEHVKIPDNVDFNQLVLPLKFNVKDVESLSDTHGRIKYVFIGVDNAIPEFIPDLIKKMRPDVRFGVIGTADDEHRFAKVVEEDGLNPKTLHFINLDDTGFRWVRELMDPYTTGSGFALRPHSLDWFNDVGFGKIFEKEKRFFQIDSESIKNSFGPKGGYTVMSDKFVFLPQNYLDNRRKESGKSGQQLLDEMREISGKIPVTVDEPIPREKGGRFQNHIDLWLTPLGPVLEDGEIKSNIVVVGNPIWGSEIAGAMPSDEKEYLVDEIIFKQVVDPWKIQEDLGRKPVLSDFGFPKKNKRQGLKQLDEFRKNMEGKGFDVRWTPYFPISPLRELGPFGGITFNNVLQENFLGQNGRPEKTIYMPTYGLPTIEDAAAKTYENLGYDVKRISGLETFVGGGGSLRCLTQIGMRGPYQEEK